jgi:hypothetical protein
MALKGSCSCYDKAADDEPIFVLRAKDVLSSRVIRHWIWLAVEAGVPIDSKKLKEAQQCADAMADWRLKNGGKIPD